MDLTKESLSVKKILAKCENCSENIFNILSQDPNLEIKLILAKNTKCPGVILHTLFTNSDRSDRKNHYKLTTALLKNCMTPASLLALIMKQNLNKKLKFLLAIHPRIDDSIANSLLQEKNIEIKKQLVDNVNISPAILEKLIYDEDETIVMDVLFHDNLNSDLAKKLLKHLESNKCVFSSLLKDKFLFKIAFMDIYYVGKDVLEKLASHSDAAIRAEVAWNKTATENILHVLINDPDITVARRARNNLQDLLDFKQMGF
jgi:predicted transcriptional regulator